MSVPISDTKAFKMKNFVTTLFCLSLGIVLLEARQKAGTIQKNWERYLTHSEGCDDSIIRGVNLGGWLLLEPWITPVFFEAVNVGDLQDKVVDEWTYAELLDPVVYKSRMLGHWSTFVARSHFEELVAAGISHVRSVAHDETHQSYFSCSGSL